MSLLGLGELLLGLSEVELVRLLSLRWCLRLCSGLLVDRHCLSLGRDGSKVGWRLRLLVTRLLVVFEVTAALSLPASTASSLSTSAATTPSTAAIRVVALRCSARWAAHLLHLGHVIRTLKRSVHAIIISGGLDIVVIVVEHRGVGVLWLVVGCTCRGTWRSTGVCVAVSTTATATATSTAAAAATTRSIPLVLLLVLLVLATVESATAQCTASRLFAFLVLALELCLHFVVGEVHLVFSNFLVVNVRSVGTLATQTLCEDRLGVSVHIVNV